MFRTMLFTPLFLAHYAAGSALLLAHFALVGVQLRAERDVDH